MFSHIMQAIPDAGHSERQFHQEDDDLARALAFSLEVSKILFLFEALSFSIFRVSLV